MIKDNPSATRSNTIIDAGHQPVAVIRKGYHNNDLSLITMIYLVALPSRFNKFHKSHRGTKNMATRQWTITSER